MIEHLHYVANMAASGVRIISDFVDSNWDIIAICLKVLMYVSAFIVISVALSTSNRKTGTIHRKPSNLSTFEPYPGEHQENQDI